MDDFGIARGMHGFAWFDLLTREPCGVPPLSGLGLRKEPVREYCTRKIVCVGRQSWNPCEMGERKRRGTPVWFYIFRPFRTPIVTGL